jgi:2-dehydro-3-deoxyphosphooctonate aldolase (KDO 8-P synthase)
MTNSAKHIEIGDIKIGNDLPFALIAGPCQIESLDHSLFMAEKIAESCQRAGVQFIYKSSFDKANRSSVSSKRGVGIDQGLEILAAVKAQFGCSVLTDVHDAHQCAKTAEVVDVLQIPAFLCRQTDLLLAAANTGAAINAKKGQFLAPWDMKNVAEKLASTGNERIMLCERGTSFGYNTLVSDFRSLPVMAETGYPVVFDATHSVQQPGGLGATTGGDRKYVPVLAKAAVAVGCAMLFIETHEDPDNAPSDGPNMVPINELEGLLKMLKNIEAVC